MRRIGIAFVIAFALATGAVVAKQTSWSPICATLSEENDAFLWWLFGCNDNPPPKDPSA